MSFVADSFAEDAFSNVQTIPIKDIYKGSAHKVGQVEQVVINGSSFFRKGDLIPYDAEIIITYHEKKEITIPFSERSLRKMNYVAAGDRFQFFFLNIVLLFITSGQFFSVTGTVSCLSEG